jgi:8-oxo-dGTP pyrophosphatase MutT (NUDIX family)
VAVVINGDQVLVMKRHKRGRSYAVLPGGGVEAGETAAEAALRELHEETTLVAEIDRLLWTGMHNPPEIRGPLAALLAGRPDPA